MIEIIGAICILRSMPPISAILPGQQYLSDFADKVGVPLSFGVDGFFPSRDQTNEFFAEWLSSGHCFVHRLSLEDLVAHVDEITSGARAGDFSPDGDPPVFQVNRSGSPVIVETALCPAGTYFNSADRPVTPMSWRQFGCSRAFLFPSNSSKAVPLTAPIFSPPYKRDLMPTRLSPKVAIHLGGSAKSVWVGRLRNKQFFASRYEISAKTWQSYKPIQLRHREANLPPYVFCDCRHDPVVLLGNSWYRLNKNAGNWRKMQGECPFQYLPQLGISTFVHRSKNYDRVIIEDSHLGKTVRITFDSHHPYFTPFLSQAFVNDGLLQITDSGHFAAFRLSNLTRVQVYEGYELIVNHRALRWGQDSHFGYRIYAVTVGASKPKRSYLTIVKETYSHVYGNSDMPFQMIDSHEFAFGHQGIDDAWAYVLAPADYRSIQVPIWQPSAAVPAYADPPIQ